MKLAGISLLSYLLCSGLCFGGSSSDVSCITNVGQVASPQATEEISSSIYAVMRAQKISCEDLSVGSSRILDVDANDSPTSVQLKYKLTRLNEKDFAVVLNLNFTMADGSSNPELIAKMRAQANACYQKADPALLGPNGEHLRLRLSEAGDAPAPPAVPLSVVTQTGRDDSQHWSAKTSCSIILHESLHLMGLVDEYKEALMGAVLDPKTGKLDSDALLWDCRSIGTDTNSIMNQPNPAWTNHLFKNAGYWESTCSCDETKEDFEDCRKSFAAGTPKSESCPTKDVRFVRQDDFGLLKEGIVPIDDTHLKVLHATKNENYKPGSSLLKAAHFTAITQPGCAVNLPFYECAVNAYGTSKEHGGTGCPLPNPPSYCRDGSDKWLNNSAQ